MTFSRLVWRGRNHLIGWDRAGRVRVHRVEDQRDLLAKPTIDGRTALLQRPQPSPHDFTGGAIHATRHLRVDLADMLRRQADGALLHVGYDIRQTLGFAM